MSFLLHCCIMYTVFTNRANKIYSEYVSIISYIMKEWRHVRQVFEKWRQWEHGRAAASLWCQCNPGKNRPRERYKKRHKKPSWEERPECQRMGSQLTVVFNSWEESKFRFSCKNWSSRKFNRENMLTQTEIIIKQKLYESLHFHLKEFLLKWYI